jgi:hypothetical protein
VSAGEGGLHTRYGQVSYGVTYLDQRFLGAEKGPTGEKYTCSRRVDLVLPFRLSCPALLPPYFTSSTMLRSAPNASIPLNEQVK